MTENLKIMAPSSKYKNQMRSDYSGRAELHKLISQELFKNSLRYCSFIVIKFSDFSKHNIHKMAS